MFATARMTADNGKLEKKIKFSVRFNVRKNMDRWKPSAESASFLSFVEKIGTAATLGIATNRAF